MQKPEIQKVKGITITHDPKAPKPFKVKDLNDSVGRNTQYFKSEQTAFKEAKKLLRQCPLDI